MIYNRKCHGNELMINVCQRFCSYSIITSASSVDTWAICVIFMLIYLPYHKGQRPHHYLGCQKHQIWILITTQWCYSGVVLWEFSHFLPFSYCYYQIFIGYNIFYVIAKMDWIYVNKLFIQMHFLEPQLLLL